MRFLNKIYSKTTDDIQTIYKILGIKISFSHNIIPPVELPQNGKKNILLISHDLTGTGAPLALFDIAKILQKNFNITVWSIGDGILYTDYQDKMNITPFVITKISKKCKRKYAKELKKFDLVIVNTIVCDYFANICSKYKIPYVWLIHEAGVTPILQPDHNSIRASLRRAKGHLYTVSDYAKNYFQTNYNALADVLNNFVYDEYRNKSLKLNKKLTFAYCGTLNENKGVVYLCQAFKELSKRYSDKCELNIIGSFYDYEYKKQLDDICYGCDNIYFRGYLSGESRLEAFENTDVFIVPSFDESSSRVVLEACMLGRPVIVTENVGAKYMVTPDTGWVVKVKSVESLQNCIESILDNPNVLEKMGQCARAQYLKTSTKEIYENNLLSIVDAHIN